VQISASKGLDHRTSAGVAAKKISDFVAPEFWSALSAEVHGLRETLETSEDEDEEETPVAEPVAEPVNKTYSTGALLFQYSRGNQGRSLPTPPLDVRTKLLYLYRSRVDSVYKILHWPTVQSTLEANYAGSELVPSSLSVQALEYAIYFMALASITDGEAEDMSLGNRSDMLLLYRSIVEDLFTRSSLLQNPDLTVLQAFVIYLVRSNIYSTLTPFCNNC
jgi:hypothetical protein